MKSAPGTFRKPGLEFPSNGLVVLELIDNILNFAHSRGCLVFIFASTELVDPRPPSRLGLSLRSAASNFPPPHVR